jgi:hypothetical protein
MCFTKKLATDKTVICITKQLLAIRANFLKLKHAFFYEIGNTAPKLFLRESKKCALRASKMYSDIFMSLP